MTADAAASASMMFAVIIALVCSKLVSDMYRFCFDPIIMLSRQDSPDQADHGIPIGKDADHISAPANLPVQPLK